jgi:hypothetical protein
MIPNNQYIKPKHKVNFNMYNYGVTRAEGGKNSFRRVQRIHSFYWESSSLTEKKSAETQNITTSKKVDVKKSFSYKPLNKNFEGLEKMAFSRN